MARRTLMVCSTPGCPEYTRGGRCADCQTKAEQRRGSSTERGYGSRHRNDFRTAVLARDPTCVCTTEDHNHDQPCGQRSRHADHYPRDRRELAAAGEDPNDPRHGRGLCGPCHSRETARHQPGGWAADQA